MKVFTVIATAVAILLISNSGYATTWQVPTDAPTIQAGIDSASAGDTVSVACGTYYEYDIVMKSGVVLRSETGLADCVTIDAEGQQLVFYCASLDAASVVEGFTITGGSTPEGAGMYCTESGLLVNRCVFIGNEAQNGAGIYIYGSVIPVVRNCTFTQNVSPGSGACVALFGLGVEFENTIVAFNQCVEPFFCDMGGTATLSCCDVHGNTGGDWVGCIEFQQGMSGNFSADPVFCNAMNEDVHLRSDSPCLNAPGCGHIGALGLGCGQIWDVPADAPTIQAGIDSASAMDTVIVACGTYYEHDITMKSGVSLQSETGLPDCVTIDADSLGRVLYGENLDSTTLIQGFTITGGYSSGDGGAMYCTNSAPTIRDCDFISNTSETYGGGLSCDASDSLKIVECTFSANSATNMGGALQAQASAISVVDCVFKDNVAWSGGAILASVAPGPVEISGSVFAGNTATSGWGGGIYASGCSPPVAGCTFYDNGAVNGGVLAVNNAPITIENTILAFSPSGEALYCAGTGSATLTCCDVYGNAGGDWVGCLAGQDSINGNFSADPGFCDAAAGDLSIRDTSPCGDAPGCGLVGALGVGCHSIWNVPAEAPTIQAGIDSASAGDTVVVACGTYYEHDIVMKSGITLRSETGLQGCVTIDADSLGRVFYCEDVDSTTTIEGFTITGGSSWSGAGIYMMDCNPVIRNCVVSGNSAELGGGMFLGYSSPTITGCTLSGNSADNGGGMDLQAGSFPTITGCTFCGNSSPFGGGISQSGGIPAALDNTIIAFSSQGEAIYCMGGAPTLTCCDIYGNAGGDWEGCIAGQDTVRGNFSEDPLFCDAEGGDFRLHASSPCLPGGNGCGVLVGAEGLGDCPYPECHVLTVPGEYATIAEALSAATHCDTVLVSPGTYVETISIPWGIVLLSTDGADYTVIDGAGSGPVVSFPAAKSGERTGSPAVLEGFTVTGGSSDWGAGIYMKGCDPVIRNCIISGNSASSGGGGMLLRYSSPTITGCMLSGNAANNGGAINLQQDSSPTITNCTFSGNSAPLGAALFSIHFYSIPTLDNTIIAFSPLGEAVNCGGGATLTCCDLYGNAGGDWVGNIAGQEGVNGNFSADPMFCEPDSGDFHIAAASPCAPDWSPPGCGLVGALGVGCGLTTIADTGAEVPFRLYLGPAVPNPFNPITEISYGIPATGGPSRVTMNIYDALGRRVTTLVDSEQGPGEYRVVWDGKDHKGSEVASGVYFYRICWNETRRMVLLK